MNGPQPSQHLIYRPPLLEDARFMRELVMQPAWQRFISQQTLADDLAARDYIERRLQLHFEREGMGLWVCEEQTSGRPVGLCGLLCRQGLPGPDLGFAFLPDFWRKGLGQESARQVLSWGAQVRALREVWAICHPDNQASRRVLQNLEFVPDGVFCPPEEQTVLLRWTRSLPL